MDTAIVASCRYMCFPCVSTRYYRHLIVLHTLLEAAQAVKTSWQAETETRRLDVQYGMQTCLHYNCLYTWKKLDRKSPCVYSISGKSTNQTEVTYLNACVQCTV